MLKNCKILVLVILGEISTYRAAIFDLITKEFNPLPQTESPRFWLIRHKLRHCVAFLGINYIIDIASMTPHSKQYQILKYQKNAKTYACTHTVSRRALQIQGQSRARTRAGTTPVFLPLSVFRACNTDCTVEIVILKCLKDSSQTEDVVHAGVVVLVDHVCHLGCIIGAQIFFRHIFLCDF